jgi:L-ascorbate metabolism protein UlaG (beta-lactamase superfamily)
MAQTQAPEPQTSRQILDEIRDYSGEPAVWWTGHNGWLIKADGVLIGTDLVLDAADRYHQSPITAREVAAELDISFATHVHGDHFNGPVSKTLVEHSDCVFVLPRSCLKKAEEFGIPKDRIQVAVPGEAFEIRGIRVQPIRALHGHRWFSVYKDANMDDCGYLITFGGKTLLQPGDSVLLQQHMELGHIDVLLFSPTEHNMHIQQSVMLINELEPDYILPQHRDTYRQTPQNRYWTNGYAAEVAAQLSRSLRDRYHILEQGEQLIIR